MVLDVVPDNITLVMPSPCGFADLRIARSTLPLTQAVARHCVFTGVRPARQLLLQADAIGAAADVVGGAKVLEIGNFKTVGRCARSAAAHVIDDKVSM